MSADDPVVMVPYDVRWPDEFRSIGQALRKALGPIALRIDHVGSTAVPGLDAKPVIDVQVSMERLEPEDRYVPRLEELGYRFDPENPDRTKRFFVGRDGDRRTHVHIRRRGSFDEQLNLLFRDFLRTHPEAAKEYSSAKRDLAKRHRDDRGAYVQAKDPTVWSLLRRAHDWAQSSGWQAGATDA